MNRLPVIYLSHGNPYLILTENEVSGFWKKLGAAMSKVKGVDYILTVSAHWEENPLRVNATETPETIYDFFGFPPECFEYKYPGKGSSELAKKVANILSKSSKFQTQLDPDHGFDHGTWVPLKWMIPDGSLPVVQLSLLHGGGMQEHIELGQLLAPLREEGVLIITTGTLVHNIPDWRKRRDAEGWATGWVADYVAPFDAHVEDVILNPASEADRIQKLLDLERHPLLPFAHPTLEHLLPVHIAAGAAGPDPAQKLFHHLHMSFSDGCYVFGHGLTL